MQPSAQPRPPAGPLLGVALTLSCLDRGHLEGEGPRVGNGKTGCWGGGGTVGVDGSGQGPLISTILAFYLEIFPHLQNNDKNNTKISPYTLHPESPNWLALSIIVFSF